MPAWAWPAAAVLVALVVRVVAWRAQPFITVDGAVRELRRAILAGRKFETIGAPGYPILIAPAGALRDRVASAALIVPVRRLLRRGRYGRWRAAASGRACRAARVGGNDPPRAHALLGGGDVESAFLFALFGALALTGVSARGPGRC
jgi:hypothetical protein